MDGQRREAQGLRRDGPLLPHLRRPHRPNEAFSGKGHARHICKESSRRPKAERERIDLTAELWGYWFQSNLSPKNLARIEALESHRDTEIGTWAALVGEVGRVHPRKRGRLGQLRKKRPDLLERLVTQGFVEDRPPYEEAQEPVWGDDSPWANESEPFEGCDDEDPDPDDVPF